MSKKTKSYDYFHLARFLSSLAVLAVLAALDLQAKGEQIPNVIYLMIGGLNGVDAFKLYNDVKKGYDDNDAN